jgi:hypothetical protein
MVGAAKAIGRNVNAIPEITANMRQKRPNLSFPLIFIHLFSITFFYVSPVSIFEAYCVKIQTTVCFGKERARLKRVEGLSKKGRVFSLRTAAA